MGVRVGGAMGWEGAKQRRPEIQVKILIFYFANKLFILLQHRRIFVESGNEL